MTDAMGNTVDFKNIILIMTGNFGMNDEKKSSLGFDSEKSESIEKSEQDRIVKFCEQAYGAEFINRVDEFIPFLNLDDKSLKEIARLNLCEIKERIEQLTNISCEIKFTEKVYALLLSMGSKGHGQNATALKRLISKEIEPCISLALLSLVGSDKHNVTISVKGDKFVSKITKPKCKN
jgi:ATP-dependent Clp protease ATP-binding subunit ClpA